MLSAAPASGTQARATISLRPAGAGECTRVFEAIFTDVSWKETDAPYLPLKVPSHDEFSKGLFARLQQGRNARLIENDGQLVGLVTAYWECEATRWLEAGIALWRTSHRGTGIGRKALRLWIDHLFEAYDVARIGLSTWSGNPAMVRCAESLGFTLEGRLRRVRYHQGVYHDALRFGVLREEWCPHR
jgi:RimJ/RimL family protein N-acetyltransferase